MTTSRYPIYLNSDDSVRLKGPTDENDPSNPLSLDSATRLQLRIYDVQNQPVVLMDGDSDPDVATFAVLGQDLFAVGQRVAVRDDTNEVFYSDVLSIDEVARTITLNTAMDGGSFVRNRTRFWVLPGDVLTGALYGTPVPMGDQWGYAWNVPFDSPGLYNDQDVIAEIDFDGGAPDTRVVIAIEARVLRANT